MAEPRFNNPYFWPPPPTMPSQVRQRVAPLATLPLLELLYFAQGLAEACGRGACGWTGLRGKGPGGKGPGGAQALSVPPLRPQLDNLVLINKIKEQLMAEKIRPPHLPPTSASSQQPLLVPPAPAESSQAVMSLPKLQQVPGLHPQAVPQPDVALHARPATSTVTGTTVPGWDGWIPAWVGNVGRMACGWVKKAGRVGPSERALGGGASPTRQPSDVLQPCTGRTHPQ